MTDKHVDELLADLDRALAVEPSAAVVARVRTRIAQSPAAGWCGLRLRFVLTVGALAAAVVTVGFYLVPSRGSAVPAPTQTLASHAPDAPAPTSSARSTVTRAPRSPQPPPVRTTARVEHEPEVIVSPGSRVALAQFAAALRDGRLSGDDNPPDGPVVLPDPIVIPSFAIVPFKLDPPPGGGSGEQKR